MNEIPPETSVFVDTNILIYSISNHPIYGQWCDDLFDRISKGDLRGSISVIILNELLHKLMIGEIAQKYGLKPEQVILRIKRDRTILKSLHAYEIVEDVVQNYNLSILSVNVETFKLAHEYMQDYRLLSNDALHLAVMTQLEISDLVTNDKDFESIHTLRI